jgi:GDP-4-dehydro-6-deoxy-D-mannose reductase
LLEGVAAHAPRARVLFVGTGQAYGLRRADEAAFAEEDPLRPNSLYAATKTAAEQRAVLAYERQGLDVIRARPLNHTGPGRPPEYAESAFARQIARMEKGLQEPVLRVGNLGGVRDFSDVRDVVRAYRLLLERGEAGGVYNVCSGEGTTLRSLLDLLIGRAEIEPRIEVDPALYRKDPDDRSALVADPGRLRALGWDRVYPLERTLSDLLEDWRSRV